MDSKKHKSYTVKATKLSKKQHKEARKRKKERMPKCSAYMYTVAKTGKHGTLYATYTMVIEGKYPNIADILYIIHNEGPIISIHRLDMEGLESQLDLLEDNGTHIFLDDEDDEDPFDLF